MYAGEYFELLGFNESSERCAGFVCYRYLFRVVGDIVDKKKWANMLMPDTDL